MTNSNNTITAKDKESNSNRELNAVNKGDINLPKEISKRIKTGKPPTSIKTIINRTLGGNNNTIIFSNMANDFNNKFLKGVEKRILNSNTMNKENKINNSNMNKYVDINKITTNLGMKNQNSLKSENNLLEDNKNIIN